MVVTAYGLAVLVVGVVLPFASEWLNGLFKVSGDKALLVAGTLSVLSSLGALFLFGQLHLTDFTLANFVPTFTAVFGLSQAVFAFVKDRLGWSKPLG